MLREESDRVSLALSDGEVGIGLSLLQDLANGFRGGNGDGDDDVEDKWSRSSGSSSVELRRHQQSNSDSENGTVEELNYARDDDDSDSDHDQEAHNQVVSSFPAPPTSLSPAASGALKSPSRPLAQSVTVPSVRTPSPTPPPSSPTHGGASGPIGRGLKPLTSRSTLNEPPSPKKDRERGGLIREPSRDIGPSASSAAGTSPSQPPPPQGPLSLKSPPQNQSQSNQICSTSVPPSSSPTQACLYDNDGLGEECVEEPGLSGDNSVAPGPVRLPFGAIGPWEEGWGRQEETLSRPVTARQRSFDEREKRKQLEKEEEKLRTEAEGGDYGTDETDGEEGEGEEERKGQEEEETGKREENGAKRKQAEDTRQGFLDWDSSGSYSQQRNSFLS